MTESPSSPKGVAFDSGPQPEVGTSPAAAKAMERIPHLPSAGAADAP